MEPSTPSFYQLFNQYHKPVYDYVFTITKDEYAAEEITQELFITIWQRQDKLADIEHIDRYIFRMAHNASMQWFVKLGKDKRLADRVKQALSGIKNNDVLDTIDYRQAKDLLDSAVAVLSPQRKKVFELSRNQGLKIPEIAELLGLSSDTVKHHLVAALAQVRQHLSKGILLLIYWLFSS